MTLTLLGTGTSNGIPVPGCSCRVCRSRDPRDRRTRCSALFEDAGSRVLVDTAPEFRIQALRAGIDRLDAVVLTHAHADHLHGLDDLRPLTWKAPLDIHAAPSVCAEVEERFAYIWRDGQKGGGKPRITLRPVPPGGTVRAGSLELVPVPVMHGALDVLGWRCGRAAYITDANRIPEASYALLEDLDVLVLGALRFRPHETHFSVDEALAEIKKIRPGRAYLTHICHEASHRDLLRALPRGIRPARDGLRLRVRS